MAEEPLPAGGSCLLGSINLSAFVNENKTFNFDELKKGVKTATYALNEVLDEGLPLHPLQEQRDSVRDWRQIGLGIMGLADMLIKMELPYDSDDAINLCIGISSTIFNSAAEESCLLAAEFGPYPKYNYEAVSSADFYRYVLNEELQKEIATYGLRNSQLLTIAPTGSISTMLGISGGIEPIFANSYTRKTESLHGKDVYYKVYTPIVDKHMKEHGLTEEEQLPEWFVTSSTIDPFKRIKMQSAWQRNIDASISSTVNLPSSATVEEIEQLYLEAWRQGLKGLTIFRSGCKRAGILTTDSNSEEGQDNASSENTLGRGVVIQCTDDLVGKKRKIITGCGSMHILAYFDPITGDMMEVYLNKGSTGGCANFTTGLSRTISLLCRVGASVFDIKDQLDSTGVCPSYAIRSATKHDTSPGSCCPMAIGNALVDMWKEMQEELNDEEEEETETVETKVKEDEPIESTPTAEGLCPECGEPLVFEGGCNSCKNCGWTKCE